MTGWNGATIRNCYAAGKVNDGSGGGLTGSNNGRVYNSYYRGTNTGNDAGFSSTTSNLKQESTFYFWDFAHIWELKGSYPVINLRGEPEAIELLGDGLSDDPYLVETEEQLYAMSMDLTVNKSQVYYQLAKDITLTTTHWTPIGVYDDFKGTFDGNSHTISGIKVSGGDYSYAGLFGYNTGTIKNLNASATISGNDYAGVLVGYNDGYINNCFTSGSVTG